MPTTDNRYGVAGFDQRRHRRPRMPEFSYVGPVTYHLVVTTESRRPALAGASVGMVRDSLDRAAEAASFEILVDAIMPDHVHILVQGTTEESNALRFVQRFKQLSSYAYKREHNGRLWQQSFYDHVMRADEDVAVVGAYILENPTRAGIESGVDDTKRVGGALVGDRT